MQTETRTLTTLALVLWAATSLAAPWNGCVKDHPWKGRTVAFLGDSITDPRHIGTSRNYWQDLGEWLGLTYESFGVNGQQWPGVRNQADRCLARFGDRLDALFVFMGTNDFNAGVPLGDWYVEGVKEVVALGGEKRVLRYRELNFDSKTFRGRINEQMRYLKEKFPCQQIILMTPIHRGYASFGPTNVQPDERHANVIGKFIDDYVAAIREAGGVWSVPVIDLHSLSGLLPTAESHARFFSNPVRDRLHPSAEGHERLARTIYAQLLALPPNFKR